MSTEILSYVSGTSDEPLMFVTIGDALERAAAAHGANDARAEIEPLPSFKDTPAGERQQLFIRKLRLCSRIMDFEDNEAARDKEIKRLKARAENDPTNYLKYELEEFKLC